MLIFQRVDKDSFSSECSFLTETKRYINNKSRPVYLKLSLGGSPGVFQTAHITANNVWWNIKKSFEKRAINIPLGFNFVGFFLWIILLK